jgi:hypothetical protein
VCASDAGGSLDLAPPFQKHFAVVDQQLTPADITPAGGTALLIDLATADFYFYDTATDTLKLEGNTGDPTADFATGISATKRVSANYLHPVQAGLWTEKDGWFTLPSPYQNGCQGDVGSAWDVSADGTVAVGMMWEGCIARPFRWDATGCTQGKTTALQILGMAPQGSSNSGPNNRVTRVSEDGKISAGFAQYGGAQDRWPARWDASGKGILLTPLPASTFDTNTAPGEALAISQNGDVLAGTGCGQGTDGRGWVWNVNAPDPQMVSLGTLPSAQPTDQIYPDAMNAQGTLIFGSVGQTTAFVWTAPAGMRSLQDVATANGISIPAGFVLAHVLGASNDGSVLVGLGRTGQPFVMVLPASAYGPTG